MNFNAKNFDNVMTAGRLSPEAVARIIQKVDDPRLKNPPGDYFHLELADRTMEIPKQEQIGVEDNKHITVLPTASYVKKLLEDEG